MTTDEAIEIMKDFIATDIREIPQDILDACDLTEDWIDKTMNPLDEALQMALDALVEKKQREDDLR